MKRKRLLLAFVIIFVFVNTVTTASAAGGSPTQYYYAQLHDFQKEIYDYVLEAPHESASCSIVVASRLSAYSEEEIYKRAADAIQACDWDNPLETRWIRSYYVEKIDIENQTIDVFLEKSEFYDEKEDGKIEEILNAIVANADMAWDDYTKAAYISSTLTSCMDYDIDYVLYNNDSKPNVDKQHITGILNGLAVCEGFAEIYKALADRLGLVCVEVASKSHSFVHIRMEDGNWYGTDPQDELNLRGPSMYQGTQTDAGWENIYEIYDGAFNYIAQPHRADHDYEYQKPTPQYEIVDVDAIRRSQLDEEEAFLYTVLEDGTACEIIGYQGPQRGDLVVPPAIDGYTVTAIGNSAFSNCKYFDGSLILPDTVEVIGSSAFAHCSGLKGSLSLPRNLKRIESAAFISCTGLDGTISFPDGLEVISDSAFSYCSSLTGDLMLPDSVTSVGSNAFFSCVELDGVLHIPYNIEEWSAKYTDWCIGLTAFDISDDHPKYVLHDGLLYSRDMTTLIQCLLTRTGDVVIPEGVVRIENLALYQCRKITSVSFPSTLTSIGNWGCAYLFGLAPQDLKLPETVTEIGDNAFYCSRYAGTIYYPATDHVGSSAFAFIRGSYRLVIPEGVTSLPQYCFEYDIFKEIYLPTSLTALNVDDFMFFSDMYVTVYGEEGSIAEDYVRRVNEKYPDSCLYRPISNYWQEEIRYHLEVEETHYPRSAQLTVSDKNTNENVLLSDWTSSDETVATVDQNGLVTAMSQGSTTIEAKADDGTVFSWVIASCHFPTEMVMWVGGYDISNKPEQNVYTTLLPGETTYVQEYYPDGYYLLPPESDEYGAHITSSNPKVIKLSGNTLIAVGEGTSVITIEVPNLRVSATFTVVPSLINYTLTYDLDGGILGEGESNPDSFTIRSEDIQLMNPTRENYVFVGWTGTDLEEPTQFVFIPAGSVGDRHYTANWIPIFGTPEMILPASLVRVEESAFDGTAMKVVYVPDGCEAIGRNAFKNCPSLEQIRIPDTVTYIDPTAFDGCGNVYVFGAPGSTAETFCEGHGNCVFVEETAGN